jgi:hypothetical protein
MSTPADACRVESQRSSILHPFAPDLSGNLGVEVERFEDAVGAEVIVAEVEMTTDTRPRRTEVREARIISMVRGEYGGTTIRFGPGHTSCDFTPRRGTRGFAVGVVPSAPPEYLLIDALSGPSRRELEGSSDVGGAADNR